MDFSGKILASFKNTKLIYGVFGIVLCITASMSFASIALAYNIVILTSKNAAPYNSFIKEFKRVLPGSSIEVKNMDGDIDKGNTIINRANKDQADLIVALGSRAAWVARNEQEIPVMFSMLSNPKKYDLDGRTGIRIGFSLRQQMQVFRTIMPNTETIGLLYSGNSKEEMKNIKERASEVGFKVIIKEVHDAREVASAVDGLLMNVDALWLRKDKIITGNARLLKQVVLLRALRKKIPIIGDNKWTVQNGALFCLFTSYQSIGAQAGGMVEQLISKGEMGFKYPLDIDIFINSNVAERLSPGVNVVVPRDAFIIK